MMSSKKKKKIKFEHLEFTQEEFKKLKLEIMTIKSVLKILNKIQEKNMKKNHESYCSDAVWRDMQERCILFSNDTKVLVVKDRFDKMIKKYGTGNIHGPGYFKVEKFNPIMAMLMRDQISEC